MHDESKDLMNSLIETVGIINHHQGHEREQIAEAYADAQALITTIGPDEEGSARPRIVACIEHYRTCRAAGDVAAMGWMLTALQERIAEKDLAGWDIMEAIADKAAKQLPVPRSRVN